MGKASYHRAAGAKSIHCLSRSNLEAFAKAKFFRIVEFTCHQPSSEWVRYPYVKKTTVQKNVGWATAFYKADKRACLGSGG
ncbi:MAG: hypothetical protein AAF557_28175 [Pseudomonadota bacterium]